MKIQTFFYLFLFVALGITSCNLPAGENENSVTTNSMVNTSTNETTKEPKDTVMKEIPKPIEKPVTKDQAMTDIGYLMGKFEPSKHKQFSKVKAMHGNGRTMYLRTEAYNAFEKMFDAAKKDGVVLQIISATRPFHHQKSIWEAKWTGGRLVGGKNLSKAIPEPAARALEILKFSSMPGTSRHHWGTDLDLNSLENSYFEKGKGLKIYEWLSAHAKDYGFCQPYSPKGEERPHGYEEEKWHWTYMPVSQKLTADFAAQIQNESIKGFKGCESAPLIDVVQKYVLGINKSCK